MQVVNRHSVVSLIFAAIACCILAAPFCRIAAGTGFIGAFALPDLHGSKFSFDDAAGKQRAIVVTFFTTWCAPCRLEHPQLQKLFDRYRDRGLLVIAVSADEPGNVAKVRTHVQRYKLTFPVLLDSDSSLIRQYDPDRTLPLTIVASRGGRIVRIQSGYVTGDEVRLEKDILRILQDAK